MWHYSPVRVVTTRRQRLRERQKSKFYAALLQVHKKKTTKKQQKKTRQLRPRNRHLEGEIALFKISSLLFQLVRDIKCRRSFLAMALDSK